MALSERTNRLLDLLGRLPEMAAGRRWFVGGGFAIDLSFGRISRDHDDIDLFVARGDAARWRTAFAALGFAIGRDVYMRFFPGAFVVGDELVEVWLMDWRSDGTIAAVPTAAHRGRAWWAGMRSDRLRTVTFASAQIWVEDPDIAVDRKLDHVRHHRERLAAKHLSDLALMGRLAEYDALVRQLGL